MNNLQIKSKLYHVTTELLHEKGFIAPIDVFLRMGFLNKSDYESWRNGKIDNIERVIKVNIGKINFILRYVHSNSLNGKLKPSHTDYVMWGKRKGEKLRFSKFGDKNLENAYSTHYVNMSLKRPKIQASPNDNT